MIEGFALGGEFAGRVGEVCAGMQTEAVQWQMTDHAGTVRLVVNASGAVIDGHDTTPFGDEIIWGAVRSANAPQLQQKAQQSAETGAGTTGLYGWNETMRARYASLERDTPTGLEHTDWRKYDGWQGRWTTTDPSHQSMSVGNPQSFNRYAYVQNDPVNFVDPSGLDGGADFLTALLLGAQVGASFSVYGGGDGFLGGGGGSGGRHVPAMELGNDEFNTGGGGDPSPQTGQSDSLPCPSAKMPLKDPALSPQSAMQHYMGGSGADLHMPINQIMAPFPTPLNFAGVRGLINQGTGGSPFVSYSINNSQSSPVQASGVQGAFLGRITFNLSGVLNVYMTGDYQFYGSIGVNSDPFDFHSSSGPHKRGLGYEISAGIGGLFSGKPFNIIIDGRHQVDFEGNSRGVTLSNCR